MSKIDKLKQALKIGAGIGSILAGGRVGSILDVVNKTINNDDDPKNVEALRDLAKVNDAQTAAIIELDERLKKLEGK